MALSETYRSRFYEHFVEHVEEEAAEAMLAQFPSRDVDELATKDFVASQISAVRAEMTEMRAEMHVDMAEMRSELRVEMSRMRVDLSNQTDRVLGRMQIVGGLGFGFLAAVMALPRWLG